MKKRFLFVLIPLFFLFVLATEASANSVDFGVKPVIPENQQDKNKSYFDLRMSPGEKRSVSLTLSNLSDKETVVAIQPNTAMTNRNGVIDYKSSDKAKDSTLPLNISDIITGEKEVTLKPKESRNITYEITMPEKPFDGMILGGFYMKKISKEPAPATDKNVQIKNEYSYVVAVAITQNDAKIDSELKLNDIKPGLENYRTVVTANIQNIKPKLEGKMSVKANVTKKGSSEILHTTEKESMSMAPNSNFDFPISWNNQELKAGVYTLNLNVTTSGGQWKFSKDFEIKAAESNKLNNSAVELDKDYTTIFIIIGSLLVVTILLLLVLIFIFRKKRTDKENQATEQKRPNKKVV
ncbi:DUF916 and DUF3324 domain-containing protein [Carnobacterium gallinarum]|uniref:DUF916 and DUF3324 domain-containing protein n=1 Tax=Carnobacterium gallinarum TaxID=2749 RepID=UPI00054D0CBE|nr:DUF916 and DUF3324 domain-containing protein [Carnobacterium gallinarum]